MAEEKEEIFSFGVKVELIDAFSKGMESMAKGLEDLTKHAEGAEKKLALLRLSYGRGLMEAAVGGAGLLLLKEVMKAA